MSEPQTIHCSSACTVTIQHDFSVPVLNLSPYEGGMIAGAILLVWAVGFVFRVLVRLIYDTDKRSSED